VKGDYKLGGFAASDSLPTQSRKQRNTRNLDRGWRSGKHVKAIALRAPGKVDEDINLVGQYGRNGGFRIHC
jgi:hypothetical protein